MVRTWPLRRRLRTSIRDSGRRQRQPAREDQVRVDGYDLLRVLVMGSGLTVGHGVDRRSAAFDGHLARQLSTATDRGVSMLNVAEHETLLEHQILAASVSAVIRLEDVIVWSPSVLEMCTGRWPRTWGSKLGELLEFTTSSRVVVVLTLPVTRGDSPLAATGADLALRINEHLRAAARRHPNVLIVDPPDIQVPAMGAPLLDSAYYAEMATRVLVALLPTLAPHRAAQLAGRSLARPRAAEATATDAR